MLNVQLIDDSFKFFACFKNCYLSFLLSLSASKIDLVSNCVFFSGLLCYFLKFCDLFLVFDDKLC